MIGQKIFTGQYIIFYIDCLGIISKKKNKYSSMRVIM